MDSKRSWDSNNLCIVLGEAGFGKTTTAVRTIGATARQVLYIPAAVIPPHIAGTKVLLAQLVEVEALLDGVSDQDLETGSRIARAAIEYLLKDEQTPTALVIDGLDESVSVSRRGGVQTLLNALKAVRVPEILLMRTEFWRTKLVDFSTSFGAVAKDPAMVWTRELSVIELLPWSDGEIASFARARHTRSTDDEARKRLEEFLALVGSGGFEELYGDIPRRPLFLDFLLDWIAQRGIQRVGRARLFRDVIQMKIARDVAAPIVGGAAPPGRVPLVSEAESTQDVIELSWRAMQNAAVLMCAEAPDGIDLLPSCTFAQVVESHEALRAIRDPAALVLHSLLVPVRSPAPGRPLELRYAHRAFQEFFLADAFLRGPTRWTEEQLPDAVQAWVSDLRDDEAAAARNP